MESALEVFARIPARGVSGCVVFTGFVTVLGFCGGIFFGVDRNLFRMGVESRVGVVDIGRTEDNGDVGVQAESALDDFTIGPGASPFLHASDPSLAVVDVD